MRVHLDDNFSLICPWSAEQWDTSCSIDYLSDVRLYDHAFSVLVF